MQKGFAPILIIILIALAVGGYFIYKNQQKPVPVPQQVTQPQDKGYTISDAKTKGWKTYTSTTNSFSFNYPSDWKIDVDYGGIGLRLGSPDLQASPPAPTSISTISKGSRLTVVRTAYDFKTLEEAADKCNAPPSDKTSILGYTTVDGLKAIKLEFPGGCVSTRTHQLIFVVLKDSHEFLIEQEYSADGENPFSNLLDQVAATFKFTN